MKITYNGVTVDGYWKEKTGGYMVVI